MKVLEVLTWPAKHEESARTVLDFRLQRPCEFFGSCSIANVATQQLTPVRVGVSVGDFVCACRRADIDVVSTDVNQTHTHTHIDIYTPSKPETRNKQGSA